ncbi:MAG: PQQ-binding-like beta-propeller repeat protein [Oscillospiraceae bacterium]|nr:PQQ-binding-like beta-propeller repeat protein [Oscillospiraceae bacterium]
MRKRRENHDKSGSVAAFVGQYLLMLVLVGVLAGLVTKSAMLHWADKAEIPEQPGENGGQMEVLPGGETEKENPADPELISADLTAYAAESSKPENFLTETAVQVNGTVVESYSPSREITFGKGSEYTDLKGIITFRGNNYRDCAEYGIHTLTNEKFGSKWVVNTGSLQAPDGNVWTGSGWTGQPLIVEWEPELRQQMNLYETAKKKEHLREVIYACMDGYIYFLDMDTGAKTRDPLNVGYTFKGTASLDPRGYPLLYVGAGYHSMAGNSRAFVINLIDGKILYTFGNGDEFAKRQWPMFDGSALVDAETDTLIYPGENGILYLIHLNTTYDSKAGTISIDPDEVVKWRYATNRNDRYWLGMESSPVVWNGYVILADNGGNLMCVDLNTLETIWVQDTLDDTNCTPVLEVEDGHPYVYVSTSFHLGWRSSTTATIPVWKIDAVNGEVIWHTDYTCYSVSGVSGGTQGTIALGKNSLSDRIFVAVSRTPDAGTGILAALDKNTGETIWQFNSKVYSWSSPVDFYDSETGKGYLIYTTSGGYIYLLDGETGEILDSMDLEGNIEASAVVYDNKVVVGHRKCKIFGIDLT